VSFALIVVFMVFMIPLTAILTRSPLGQALADRIAGRSTDGDPRLLAEIDMLRSELDQVHEQLSEVHERLDFSERMLAARSPDGGTEATP
jgi:hypothetical protein